MLRHCKIIQQYRNSSTSSSILSAEGLVEALTRPMKITYWPHPFLTHFHTPNGRGVAPFIPALQCRNSYRYEVKMPYTGTAQMQCTIPLDHRTATSVY